jgi:two-component system response regulator YesN
LLKIIIIEDDNDTRLGLSETVDWSSLGISFCGSAANGRLGIELARKVRPEIAILDVRMPILNGLECAREIRKFLPQCNLVFLSGYSDKEYLKEAIKLQAVEYLEKPVDLDELTGLLGRIVQNYEITQLWKGFSYRNDNRYQKIFAQINEYMDLWINNQLEEERFVSWVTRLQIAMDPDGYYYCFYTLCKDRRMLSNEASIKINGFEEIFDKYPYISYPYENGIGIIAECDRGMTLPSVYTLANQINTICQQKCDLPCVTAMTDGAKGYRSVAQQFRTLSKRIQLYLKYGYGTVITPAMSQKSKSKLSETDINYILYLISADKIQVALKELECLQLSALESGEEDIKQVQMLFIYLYFSIHNVLSEKGIISQVDILTEMMNNLNLLQSFPIQAIAHLCSDKISILSQFSEDRGIKDARVKKVILYMQSNYSGDISLEDMAQSVSLSPAYLCSIFKKETGKNVMQYLEDIRVTKSLSLLSRSDLSVAEIAKRVGYHTPHYFAQIFKRITGIPPSSYRKQA